MTPDDEERFRALIETAIEEDGLARHKGFKKDVKADKKRKAKADKVGHVIMSTSLGSHFETQLLGTSLEGHVGPPGLATLS